MRLFLLIAAAWPALAAAQFVGRIDTPSAGPPNLLRVEARGPRVPTSLEIGDIAHRIDNGREAGRLSRREARQLRRENRQLAVLARRYSRNGLSSAERQELETRSGVLRAQVDVPRAR